MATDRGPRPAGRPPSGLDAADEDHRWLENWQRNEIAWLTRRLQEVERRLRRRTAFLGSLAILSALAAGALALTSGSSHQRLLSLMRDGARLEMPTTPPLTAAQRSGPVITGAGAASSPEAAARPPPGLARRAPPQPLEQRAGAALKELTTGMGGQEWPLDSLQADPDAGHANGERAQPEGPARSPVSGQGEDTDHYAVTVLVDLRGRPSAAADPLAVVRQGMIVRRLDDEDGWLKVGYSAGDGREIVGWIRSDHVRPVPAPSEANRPGMRR